ncbi:uncharacterized protein N7477_002827 [Penicillium maclennaniae]|uniref:uncharacterized protein n=1 Tax=Penicillium maclennaniae TaxID=1343394 RepID=UPI002540A85D|nr:uncharacterized protein N7477_002827 [Penicillium maclennaniae]KAJ5677194.1 hypothetical protein N7477_002827 [Penicillium maclennaniae]
MRFSIVFTAAALALGASAETSSVNYLTETNSLGVVTGQPTVVTSQPTVVTSQPTVVTSQPAVVTSQEPAASIPAGLTSPVVTPVTVSGSKTLVTSSGSSSSSSSSSSGAASSTSTGGAAMATAGLGMFAGAALAVLAL